MKTNSLSQGNGLTRRSMFARLGVLAAGVVAAPSALAKPALPRCGKGGEQLVALREYERALNALPSEADCPVLKELHARYSARPMRKKMIPTTRAGHTANLAVFQTGKLGADRVVVLLHGCVSDHETWWYVAGALGGDHELWLLDLPGCGASEGHPAHLEPDAFTPTAFADRVGQVLETCLAERAAQGQPAPRLTLVGHSLGGAYSLRLVSAPELRQRFAGVRKHVDALVLFAPCDVAVNHLPPSFQPLLGLSPATVAVGRALSIVNDKVNELTRRSYFLPECATREQAERFSVGLTVPKHLRSAQAMLKNAVPWRMKENRPDWPAIEKLQADYANVDVPCVIAWGEWDETLSETMGHKLRDKLPHARLVEIHGSGHSAISERPLACAHVIRTGEEAAAAGSFAGLPTVCGYGEHPFDGPETLAAIG